MKVSIPTIDGTPVLLPAHSHREFGTPGRHYHVDFRYCDEVPRQDRVIHSEEKPIYMEFELVRGEYTIVSAGIKLPLWLANKYKNCVAVNGVCPHKKLPVMNGVCTGHGMAFTRDGVVAQDYYLKAGKSRIMISAKQWKQKVFEIPVLWADTISCLELLTVDERLIGSIPMITVYACSGDTMRITIT